ncbi:Sodium/hydrogen exchanger family-domain-containing protein [Collybia nuda]|uniref:Sodium/hydrogen exchanger family-domain-containing protein n=1 Tax=Collybia nuda TaxID=64659 RepID=A0A9P6CF85_9AGAR|nr:Sodium/hydrogen exchanger family-domain-containing protein [Collybia nuda]
MVYQLLEVTGPGLAYICLGGFVVAFSMFSLLMKQKFYINEVVLGTAFGIIMGPHVANVFDPRTWGESPDAITLEVTRIVLATGLFAIGVELPRSYMAKHVRGLFVMVVPTMALGWVIVAGLVYGLFPRLTFVSCLAIAACLTPTDPIICAAIVGGKYAKKNVPLNLRQILSAESAANDGLAFPFLTISLYLILDPTARQAVGHWVLVGCLYQVTMGVVIGAILGLIFSYLMKFSHRHGFIDRESYVAQYLALAIFTTGVVSTIGSDDLLAAFAAGSAISWDGDFNVHTEDEVFSSVIDLVLNCACFIYIGAWLPFTSFDIPSLGISPWRLTVLFLAILALRRIPAILMLYRWIPEISTWSEALFSGHFGPMGVGAVFISSLALHTLEKSASPLNNEEAILAACLQPIVAFVVLGSIIIHGLSIPFVSLGKKVHTRTISSTLSSKKEPEWVSSVHRMPPTNTEKTTNNVPARGDPELPDIPRQQVQSAPTDVMQLTGVEVTNPKAVHFPGPE